MKKGKEDKNQEKEGTEKNQAIEAALSQIEKQFGKGSIMRLGSSESKIQASSIVSTGSLELDVALGIGGFPSGRIIEIYGPESSGKTTLTLSAVAEAQKKGGVAAFIDAEHALDPSYARKLGVNVEDLLVAQPDNGEEALEICESLVRSNAIDIIVIDSVAALVPRAEIEGDMGDSHMGLQARLMSQALRKLTGTIAKSNTTVIFINQIRMKIGVMFGSPETTTGGNALKFYASIRLDIRRIETLKEKEEPVGNRVRVKVVKNKMAPPFRQAEFDVMFSTGINRESTLIDMAVRHDLLAKAGSWYSYNGEKIGQGKEQVRNFFLENPDIAFKVENQIRDLNGLPILVATKAAPAEKKAKEKAIPSLEVEEAPEKEEIQREVAVGE
ncbi:MAG: recombinase RecA [Leptospira sp.]|nr:MAG: recombinase RecA [Leptospira sp.]